MHVNVCTKYHVKLRQNLHWRNRQRFGVRLQKHRQEITQRDVIAYTRSTSKSAATEQNKSAVTDHAIFSPPRHRCMGPRQGDRQKVIGWIREATHIRKEQDKSMNRGEGSYSYTNYHTSTVT